MKRVIIIFLFFVLTFAVLCLTSCTCEKTSTEMEHISCGGKSCYQGNGKVDTLNGCHCQTSCIDCIWYPCAFGCYPNTACSARDCAPPSCVFCGFDFTLLECYGDTAIHGTDEDLRTVREAVEGVDYRIDSIKIVVNDDISTMKEFTSGNISFSKLDDFLAEIIGLINLKDAAEIDFYIEYTALTELNKMEFGVDIIYNGFEATDFSNGAYAKAGNVISLGSENYKSQNIPEGKHFLHAGVSLHLYELLKFKEFSNMTFTAYAYEEK